MLSCTNKTSQLLPQSNQQQAKHSQWKLEGNGAAEEKARELEDDELEAIAGCGGTTSGVIAGVDWVTDIRSGRP